MWKPVEISGNLFAEGVNDLIGIEECVDYDINSIIKGKNKKRKSISRNDKKTVKSRKIDSKSNKNSELFSPSKSGGTLSNDYKNTIELNNSLEDNEDVENTQAWSDFGLPKSILKAISECKFVQPTEIQRQTLPAAIHGRRDILGAAETGSGKTLAFGLPMLTGILRLKEKDGTVEDAGNDNESSESEKSDDEADNDGDIGLVKSYKIKSQSTDLKPLYGLILTPTRELAMQIHNHLKAVAKYTDIHIAVVVGGMAAVKQERILGKAPEIVVATPGRLWELIQQGNEHLNQVNNIRFLAIDETDRMLERGHFQELHELLERINFNEESKKLRQNFVFSATLTLVHDLPKHLVNKRKVKRFRRIAEMSPAQKLQKIIDSLGITEPKVVDLTQGIGTSSTLTECRISCLIDEKDYYVYYFLTKHPGRTLIFCNSIGCVKRLSNLLGLLDCHPLPLHASMQQRQRLKNLERFRDVENSILVATDVAARGLDIPCVEHVLHYQTPRTSEAYVHRSGRTARASNQGITVLLMEPKEFKSYVSLCKTLEKDQDIPIFPVQDNYLNAVKQRVNLARELDKLDLQVRKANSESGWLSKAAEDMDIIVDDITTKYDTEEARSTKKSADFKRKQLAALLAKPVFPKGFSSKFPQFELTSDLIAKAREGKAIDVMKNALMGKKKRIIPLFKATKSSKGSKTRDRVVKLNQFRKNKKVESNRQKKKMRFKKRSG